MGLCSSNGGSAIQADASLKLRLVLRGKRPRELDWIFANSQLEMLVCSAYLPEELYLHLPRTFLPMHILHGC